MDRDEEQELVGEITRLVNRLDPGTLIMMYKVHVPEDQVISLWVNNELDMDFDHLLIESMHAMSTCMHSDEEEEEIPSADS